MDLTELIEMGSNQGIGRTSLHLVDPGENPRSHLLQLPGAPALLAHSPSLYPQIEQHHIFDSLPSLLFPPLLRTLVITVCPSRIMVLYPGPLKVLYHLHTLRG